MLNPLPSRKWNYRTAAHLLNRAGFGGSPSEIEKLVKLGPTKAVDSLVDYEKIPEEVAAPEWANNKDMLAFFEKERTLREQIREAKTEEERSNLRERQRTQFQLIQRDQFRQIFDLRGWWLKRMASTPRPL